MFRQTCLWLLFALLLGKQALLVVGNHSHGPDDMQHAARPHVHFGLHGEQGHFHCHDGHTHDHPGTHSHALPTNSDAPENNSEPVPVCPGSDTFFFVVEGWSGARCSAWTIANSPTFWDVCPPWPAAVPLILDKSIADRIEPSLLRYRCALYLQTRRLLI
jgi:hypothetical protein